MTIEKKKFGGMIATGFDPQTKKKIKLNKNDLAFSHGRSAMIWLVKNENFNSCIMCNYTWPAIPTLMKKLKLKISFFDLFEKKIEEKILKLEGRVLVIIPVFYGFKPWIDYKKLEKKFGNKIFVLIDAAQTAYGHLEYKSPKNGAILSCPHKSLGVNDGGILRFKKINDKQKKNYDLLKREKIFLLIKKNSRILLNSNDSIKEKKGLKISKKLEENWNSFPPKKMSIKSLNKFRSISPLKHRIDRLKNYKYLYKHLKRYFINSKELKLGTPFGYPLLFKKRDALIKILHKDRVFATGLWSNNPYISKKFKNSYYFKKNFLTIPVDQRYDINDLVILVQRVKDALKKIK